VILNPGDPAFVRHTEDVNSINSETIMNEIFLIGHASMGREDFEDTGRRDR
jgi:hypothetical protein